MAESEVQEVRAAVIGALDKAYAAGERCLVVVRCRDNTAVDQARAALMREKVAYGWRSLPVAQLTPPDLVGYLLHAGSSTGPAFLAYGLPRTKLGEVLPEFLSLLVQRTPAYTERPSLCVLLVTMEEVRGMAVPARLFWANRTAVVAWPDVDDKNRYLPSRVDNLQRRSRNAPARGGFALQRELGGIGESYHTGPAGGTPGTARSEPAPGFGTGQGGAAGGDQERPDTPWAGARFTASDPDLPDYLRNVTPPAGRRWGHQLFPNDPESAAQLNLCRQQLDAREIELARQGLAKCAKQCRSQGNMLAAAECYVLLGTAGEARADFQVALDWYSHALDLFRQNEDAGGLSDATGMIGRIHFMNGDIDGAARHFEDANTIDRRVEDQLRMASSYRRLGIIAERRNEFAQALTSYKEAMNLEEANGDRYAQSRSLNHLARVSRCQGELEQAESLLERSLAIKEEMNDESGLAASYHELGNLQFTQRRFAQCLEPYQKALDLEQRHQDVAGIAATKAQLGLVYRHLNNVEESVTALLIARMIFERLKAPEAELVASAIEATTRALQPGVIKSLKKTAESFVAGVMDA